MQVLYLEITCRCRAFISFLDVYRTNPHKWNLDRCWCESCCGQESNHPISDLGFFFYYRMCQEEGSCSARRAFKDWGLFQAIWWKCGTFLQIQQHVKKHEPHFPAHSYRRNNWFEWNHTAAWQVLKHALKWIWDSFPAALRLARAAM